MDKMAVLASLIADHAKQDGPQSTPIDGLTLVRSSGPTFPKPSLRQPALCIVAQGRKQMTLGQVSQVYDPSCYLVLSVALPVLVQVVTASPAAPYLCMRIHLDRIVAPDIVADCDPRAQKSGRPGPGLKASELDDELIDVCIRLLRQLGKPGDMGVMVPLILKELYYQLLSGEQAETILQLSVSHSSQRRISRTIAWIKENYKERIDIADLADLSSMSRSAFHLNFKAVTSMSPLQFVKSIRLQEARRHMIVDGRSAMDAAYEVGYSSATQFTREYRRQFGRSPARDVRGLRGRHAAVGSGLP